MTRLGKVGLGIGGFLILAAGILLDRSLEVAGIAATMIVVLAVMAMIRRQAWGAFVFGWAMVVVAVGAALALLLSGFNPSPYASPEPDTEFNPLKLVVLVMLPAAIGAAVLAFRFGRP